MCVHISGSEGLNDIDPNGMIVNPSAVTSCDVGDVGAPVGDMDIVNGAKSYRVVSVHPVVSNENSVISANDMEPDCNAAEETTRVPVTD